MMLVGTMQDFYLAVPRGKVQKFVFEGVWGIYRKICL